MNRPYTVGATVQAQQAGAVALAIASLPESFTPAAPGPVPDVQVLHGTPGWVTEAIEAITSGIRAVVVVSPAPEDTGPLQAVQQNLAAVQGNAAVVVLDQKWASNPAMVPAAEAVRSMAGRAAMLDSVATAALGTDPGELFADHLAAVVRLTGPLDRLSILHRGPQGYTATAVLANGAPAALQGVVSNARPAQAVITVLTDDGGVTVSLPEPVAAWPATVKATGAQGDVLLPTLYESAHRSTWRRLKEHLDAGTNPSDLHRFAALTESIAALT